MNRTKSVFSFVIIVIVLSGCSQKKESIPIFDCKNTTITAPMTVNLEIGQYIPEVVLDGEIWRLDTGTSYFTITEETLMRQSTPQNSILRDLLYSGITDAFSFNDFFGYQNNEIFMVYIRNSHINTLNLQAFRNCRNVIMDYTNQVLVINADDLPDKDRGSPLRLEFDGELGYLYETLIEWNGEEVWVKIDTGAVLNGERCEVISPEEYLKIRRGEQVPDVPRTKRDIETAELQIGPWYYANAPVIKKDADTIMYLSEFERVSSYYESCLGLPVFANRKLIFDFERMLFFLV